MTIVRSTNRWQEHTDRLSAAKQARANRFSPKHEWTIKLEELIQQGLSRPQAVRQLATSNPDLRQRYVDSLQPKPAATHGPTDVERLWSDELQALVDKGVPRRRAVSMLVKREPELHAAYIGELQR